MLAAAAASPAGSLTSHSVPEFAAAETERKQQFGRTPSPAAAAKVGRRTDLAIYQYRDRPCAYHFKAVTWCCRPARAPDAFLAIDPVASLRPARRSAVAVSCPGLSMATGARVPSRTPSRPHIRMNVMFFFFSFNDPTMQIAPKVTCSSVSCNKVRFQ